MAVLCEVWVFLEMGNSVKVVGDMQTLGSEGDAGALPISLVDVCEGAGASGERDICQIVLSSQFMRLW